MKRRGRKPKYKLRKVYAPGAPILSTRIDEDVYEYVKKKSDVREYIQGLVRSDMTSNGKNIKVVGNILFSCDEPIFAVLACAKCGGSILVRVQEKAPLGVGCSDCRSVLMLEEDSKKIIEGIWKQHHGDPGKGKEEIE